MQTYSTTKQPRMTATDAHSFSRYSARNAAEAAATLRRSGACSGACEPYQDMFTFQRWLAQGYAVRRGQHGAKLGMILDVERENADGELEHVRRPWATTVFCRCQVDRAKVRA